MAKLPESKLSKVLAAMDAGDWRKAIGIASKFHDLGKQKEAISRAAALYLSERIYAQMGLDRQQIIEEGNAALRERFEPMRKRK